MSAGFGRWFRAVPDSSVLPRPRLLARTLIDVADLDGHIDFYQRLLGAPADLRMPIPDFGGLELAAVGGLLIIASERPFTSVQRRTAYSLIVPSLREELDRLGALGGAVLEPPETIVPGARARVRYPDGSVAELVEHRPRPGERSVVPANTVGPAAGERPPTVRLLARRAVSCDDLAAALAFYTRILDATADFIRPGSATGTELAVIGNLLLVASGDGGQDPTVPAFALLVGTPGEAADVQDGLGARLVTLPGGQRAEAWGTCGHLTALPASVR
jgi:catechol 2,3-dioxygenase-like lactoylglutathione lyase family enzyme